MISTCTLRPIDAPNPLSNVTTVLAAPLCKGFEGFCSFSSDGGTNPGR
jgi:hypothetical protein